MIYSFLFSISYSLKYRYSYLSRMFPGSNTSPVKTDVFHHSNVVRLERFPAKRTACTEKKRLLYIWLPKS